MNAPSYIEQVEQFFFATVRRGLVLRPADADVVRDWEQRGVPVDVVRRGITLGVRHFVETAEPHEPVPAALKYYRATVEREFEAYRRMVGRGVIVDPGSAAPRPAIDLATAALNLIRERRAACTPREAEALDAAAERLRGTGAGGAVVDVLGEVDDALADATIDAATEVQRYGVVERVQEVVALATQHGLGRAAVADIERAERRAAAAELGFRSLVDALIAAGGGT